MFDLGGGELLVIGIVALIVIGPKELPGLLRTVGQGLGKLRRMASDFQGQFNEAMKEADLGETQQILTDLHSTVRSKFDISKIADMSETLSDSHTKPSGTIESSSNTPEIGAEKTQSSPNLGTSSDLAGPAPVIVSEVAEVAADGQIKAPRKKRRTSEATEGGQVAVEENRE